MSKGPGRPAKRTIEQKGMLVQAFVDVPTKAKIDQIAAATDSSVSRILRQAIFEYIERRNGQEAS